MGSYRVFDHTGLFGRFKSQKSGFSEMQLLQQVKSCWENGQKIAQTRPPTKFENRKYFAVVLENRKSQNRAAGVWGALRSVASWSMLQLGPKVPATERRAPQTPAARF